MRVNASIIAVSILFATAFGAWAVPTFAQTVTTASTTTNPEHEATFEDACQCVKHKNFKDAHHKLNNLADKQHAKALTAQV